MANASGRARVRHLTAILGLIVVPLDACSRDATAPSPGSTAPSSFAYAYAPGSTVVEVLPGFSANTSNFEPHAINAGGIVVGHEFLAGEQVERPVQWAADGSFTALSAPEGGSATAINTAGVVVGYTYAPGTQTRHAVKWVGGTMSRLAEPAPIDAQAVVQSEATGINDAGQVVGMIVGSAQSPGGNRRAVVWETDGSITVLPLPDEASPNQSWGYVINGSGEVGGIYWDATYGARAVRWSTAHQPAILPDLGHQVQSINGINASGSMVGMVFSASGAPTAVVWGQADLAELPSSFTFISGGGIADDGAIIATSSVGGVDRAVIRQSGQTIDLGDPAGGAGWNRGVALNQVGGVAVLCFMNGDDRQYLGACRGRPSTAGGNHAPTAALANATGNEGVSITLDASASFDSDGDALIYTFSFGDGSANVTGSAAQASHTYADNGSYSASVTVSDPSAAQSQAGAAVTIANVAPTLGAPQLTGLTTKTPTTLTAQVTDPGVGDAPWSYTIAWGDGKRSTTGAGSGGQISASYLYHSAGSYSISISVRDKDGATANRSVTAVVTQVKKK